MRNVLNLCRISQHVHAERDQLLKQQSVDGELVPGRHDVEREVLVCVRPVWTPQICEPQHQVLLEVAAQYCLDGFHVLADECAQVRPQHVVRTREPEKTRKIALPHRLVLLCGERNTVLQRVVVLEEPERSRAVLLELLELAHVRNFLQLAVTRLQITEVELLFYVLRICVMPARNRDGAFDFDVERLRADDLVAVNLHHLDPVDRLAAVPGEHVQNVVVKREAEGYVLDDGFCFRVSLELQLPELLVAGEAAVGLVDVVDREGAA